VKTQGRGSAILAAESIRPRGRALGEGDAVGMQEQLGADSLGCGCQGKKAGGDGQSQSIFGQQSQQERSPRGWGKKPAWKQSEESARQLGSGCTATG